MGNRIPQFVAFYCKLNLQFELLFNARMRKEQSEWFDPILQWLSFFAVSRQIINLKIQLLIVNNRH